MSSVSQISVVMTNVNGVEIFYVRIIECGLCLLPRMGWFRFADDLTFYEVQKAKPPTLWMALAVS